MTVKQETAPTPEVHVNGNSNSNGPHKEENYALALSAFQQSYFKKLIADFERAQTAVGFAQDAANDFVIACAKEQGITLGQDGWTFDQAHLEFMRVPQPAQGDPKGA